MIFKCKMCGGSMDLTENPSVICCEYCGTKQTLPKLETNKRENLYDRAGHFRRNNDYDKAMQIYEQILNDNPEDAESYWSLVLCKYGIEYVKDPKTGKRIPTVNRTQTTSVFADDDYKLALKYADEKQKEVYEQEAKAIDDIQKGILEISRKEKPFDVFICYKETDENGRRTQDSVLANDLYHQLTQEGFKVFFARITLEDKLGTAYEPYIFAALTSAKVMVVLGTCPEHFNAVWVKNEWSRFLSLTKANKDKMLIPAYRDMNPYDLPEEFSHLQSQDMSKLGFMQDLIRGIKKIIQPQAAVQHAAAQMPTMQAGTNIEPLIKRMFILLEDSMFNEANEYSEKILEADPENAEAYFGKLLIEHKLNTADGLANLSEPFNTGSSYKRLMMYADTAIKEKIEGYLKSIEAAKLNEAYNSALSQFKNATAAEEYEQAAQSFAALGNYKDSVVKKEEAERKEKIVSSGNIIAISAGDWHTVGLKADGTCVAVGENEHGQCNVSAWRDIIAISAGGLHTVGLKRDGTCVAVGKNKFGQCKVSSWEDIIAVSAGLYHTVALKKDGSCVAIGYNKHGQCNVSEWKDIIAVSSGWHSTIGLKADGTCVAVGDNSNRVSSWKDTVDVLAGYNYTIGLKADGTCVAVGMGYNGQCISNWKDIYAASAGHDHIVGLKKDGTCVVADESNSEQSNVSEWKDIVAISAGFNHTVGLKADGTCVAVGRNDEGQCNVSAWGMNTQVANFNAEIPKSTNRNAAPINNYSSDKSEYKKIIAIAAGDYHTVGLKADGTCVAVGDNEDGQCDVTSWKDIIAVTAGSIHTVGLKADGTCVYVGFKGWCNVSNWKGIIAITAGSCHTVGLKADGTCVAVGDNGKGQSDVSTWKDIIAIAAGKYNTVGLKKDGTCVAVGDNEYCQCNVSEWKDIIAIVAGDYHTVGLKKDGTCVAVGDNGEQCNVSEWKDIIAISAGSWHTVGLKKDGTCVAVGSYEEASTWKDVIAISAGSNHTVGLKKDGTCVADGKNKDGRCNVETWGVDMQAANFNDKNAASINNFGMDKLEHKKIIAIVAGDSHTVGLKADGTCVAVGENDDGQCDVSEWKDIIAVSAGSSHTVGLKKDGTCVAVGYNEDGQCDVTSWKDIMAIAARENHTIGLKKDGTCVAVGEKNQGQCDVSDWKDIIAIAAGYDITVGLKKDGTCVAVGDNYCEQCDVTSWKDIIAIAVGSDHTVGLKKDGTCVAVGYNEDGQCDVTSWKDIIAIAVGSDYTVGLKKDGTCVAVGLYDEESTWKDIIAISAGWNHTIGLKADGTCIADGNNDEGQCNVSSWGK